MKKTVIFAVCLLLMAAVVFSVAAAELTATLSADKTELKRGESVVVTVSISEFADCRSGAIKLAFNESLFASSENKWFVENALINEPNMPAVFAYTEGKTMSGNLYQFKLTAKEDAAFGASDVSVTVILNNASGEQVTKVETIRISVVCDHTYENACDTTCDICGAERTTEHEWNSGEVTQEPTCTKEGVRSFACTICDATKTEPVAIVDHSWNGGEITTAPTCSAEGLKTYTCSGCGTTKTEKLSMTEHSWNGGEVAKEPTCTQDGEKKYTCGSCSATKSEKLTKKGHAYDNACDASCNNCGETRTIQHAYKTNWSSDRNGHWHQCSVCGARKDEAAHIPGAAATEYTAQTCTACGYVIQPAAGHTHDYSNTWTSDETGHWHTCSGCSELKDKAAHAYSNACDTDCNLCGYQRETTHTPTEEWTQDSESHWKNCTICGEVQEKAVHTMENNVCSQCGYDASAASHEHIYGGQWLQNAQGHWHTCNVCGIESAVQSHIWDDGVVTREPTQTVAGVRTYTCLFCNYEKTETIPSLSNTDEDPADTYWVIIVALVGVLVLCCCVILLVGINVGKKRTGKYSMK